MCLCLIELFIECLRDAAYSYLRIIGRLLVSNQEWSPYGRKQTIAVLLWNVFSTWIPKLSLLPCPYQIPYLQLVYQQKNEGQHCTLCSLQFRGREGMSQWEPVLYQFQLLAEWLGLLAEWLGLRYIGFIHSKAVVSQAIRASSSVGYFWKKSVLLHLSLLAPVSKGLHQEWDHVDQQNMIQKKKKNCSAAGSVPWSCYLLW